MKRFVRRLKKLLGIGVEGGWDDVFVRAWKTAVELFMSMITIDVVTRMLTDHQLPLGILHQAAIVAGGAAYAILWNAVLEWSRTRR